MAEMPDSERVIWPAVRQYRDVFAEAVAWQQVVAVMARRQAGVLVIEPHELVGLPPGLTLVSTTREDGRIVICAVEPDESEPGHPG